MADTVHCEICGNEAKMQVVFTVRNQLDFTDWDSVDKICYVDEELLNIHGSIN